jgi:hypothetical protein
MFYILLEFNFNIIWEAFLTAVFSFSIAYFVFHKDKSRDRKSKLENEEKDSKLFFMKLRLMLEQVNLGLIEYNNVINFHKESYSFINQGKHLSSIKLSEYNDYYDERVIGYAVYNRKGSEEDLFKTYFNLVFEFKILGEKIIEVEKHYNVYIKKSKEVWNLVVAAHKDFETHLSNYSFKNDLVKNGCTLYKDLSENFKSLPLAGIGTLFEYKYSHVREKYIVPLIEITEKDRDDNDVEPNFIFHMDMLKRKNELIRKYANFSEENGIEILQLEEQLNIIHRIREGILQIIVNIENVRECKLNCAI